MKIALLGGNSYSYGNAPSYARANGRGVITRKQLLGQDSYGLTEADFSSPKDAYDMVQYYKSMGWDPPPAAVTLAKQYKAGNVDTAFGYAERGMSLLEKGVDIYQDISGKTPASPDANASRAGDNTALIIIGGVAAVAVVGVILSSKKKKGKK